MLNPKAVATHRFRGISEQGLWIGTCQMRMLSSEGWLKCLVI